MLYQYIKVLEGGDKIIVNKDFLFNVFDQLIIFYIEGDGMGFDIMLVMIKVVDVVVVYVYKGKCKIYWMEIFVGEKVIKVYGLDVWLLDEMLQVLKEYVVLIKGLFMILVGGGICLLNVVLC